MLLPFFAPTELEWVVLEFISKLERQPGDNAVPTPHAQSFLRTADYLMSGSTSGIRIQSAPCLTFGLVQGFSMPRSGSGLAFRVSVDITSTSFFSDMVQAVNHSNDRSIIEATAEFTVVPLMLSHRHEERSRGLNPACSAYSGAMNNNNSPGG